MRALHHDELEGDADGDGHGVTEDRPPAHVDHRDGHQGRAGQQPAPVAAHGMGQAGAGQGHEAVGGTDVVTHPGQRNGGQMAGHGHRLHDRQPQRGQHVAGHERRERPHPSQPDLHRDPYDREGSPRGPFLPAVGKCEDRQQNGEQRVVVEVVQARRREMHQHRGPGVPHQDGGGQGRPHEGDPGDETMGAEGGEDVGHGGRGRTNHTSTAAHRTTKERGSFHRSGGSAPFGRAPRRTCTLSIGSRSARLSDGARAV